MGVLGWSPSEFWEATPSDLYLAMEGWQMANGGGEENAPPEALTMDELHALMEKFPDG